MQLRTHVLEPPSSRLALASAQLAFAAVVTGLVVLALLPGLLAPSLDAAVFAVAGDRLAAGDLPYAAVFDHKPPGIYFITALGDLLARGVDAWSVSWGISALAITLTAVVVAGTLRQLGFRRSAWVAGAACAVALASFPLALGGGLTESVAALPAAASFRLVAIGPSAAGRRMVAGLCAGLAAAFSLQAAPVLVGVLVVGALRREDPFGWTRSLTAATGWTVAGAATAWMVFVVLLGSGGALPAAVSALVRYNAAFAAIAHLDDPVGGSALHALFVLGPLVVAAVAGLRSVVAREALTPVGLGALAWIGSSLVMIALQGRMELHYVALLAIPLSILAAPSLQLRIGSGRLVRQAVLVAVLLVASGLSLALISGQTAMALGARSQQANQTNQVAGWIQQRTSANASIFVWGNAPDVYLRSERAPASGFVYLLPLTTPGYVNEELISEVLAGWRADPPAAIVDAGSTQPGSPGLPELLIPRDATALDGRNVDLLDPLRAFVREHYRLAETVSGWPIYVLD